MKTRINFISIFTFLFLFSTELHAQWARGTDNIYAQLAFGRSSGDQGFNNLGETGPLGSEGLSESFSDIALYFYLEYGLNEDLTFIVSTFAKSMDISNTEGSYGTTGLSDLTTMIRYTLPIQGPVRISPEVGLRIPTGYDQDAAPPLGSGMFDGRFGTSIGMSLDPVLPGYLGGSFGFAARGGDVSNETYGHLEAGLRPVDQLFVRARWDFVNSTENSGLNDSSQLNLTLEQAYYTLGPGLTWIVDDTWQVNADLRWTIAGRTTAKLGTAIFGVAWVR